MEPDEQLYSVYEVDTFMGYRTETLRCWDMTLQEAYEQAHIQIGDTHRAIIREQTHRRLPSPNGRPAGE